MWMNLKKKKIGQPRRLRKMFLLTGSHHRHRQLIFHDLTDAQIHQVA